jgi:phosphate transport system permease protein
MTVGTPSPETAPALAQNTERTSDTARTRGSGNGDGDGSGNGRGAGAGRAAENAAPAGPVPAAAPDPAPERRFSPRVVTGESVFTLLGSAAAAFGLAWLVYERILPFSGAFGFWIVWYGLLFVFYCAGTAMARGRRAVSDHLAGLFAASVGLLILAVVLDQIGYLVFRGASALGHASFFTQTMASTGPLDPLTSGGVLHAMVGSVEQVGIATILAVPLGVLAALFIVEIGGRGARAVRSLVEAMTSLPEIIAGLFIYALFILTFGLSQSGFAGGLALAVMMIPYVARASEVMLRLVPNGLREASYALGSSQWRTVWNVVLPTARSGLTTAVVLGIARAVGETAPVLLTTGFSSYMNANPFSGWQTGLPLFIYESVREPQATMIQRAFGAALVLMFLILLLFTIARVLGGAAPGEISRRRRRRMTRDLNREPRIGAEPRPRRVRRRARVEPPSTGADHDPGPDNFEEASRAAA